MLRTKYRSYSSVSNLKQDREKKVTGYLERCNSTKARISQSRITERQGREKGGGATTKIAAVGIDPARSEKATNANADGKENKVRVREDSLAVAPALIDRPSSSKSVSTKNFWKYERSKSKERQDAAIQMRQNLSAEKLQGNEDFDDDSLEEERERRPRYILVGWDHFRSKIMLFLLVLFFLWASIYFPLIRT